jgi:hypothetical protein
MNTTTQQQLPNEQWFATVHQQQHGHESMVADTHLPRSSWPAAVSQCWPLTVPWPPVRDVQNEMQLSLQLLSLSGLPACNSGWTAATVVRLQVGSPSRSNYRTSQTCRHCPNLQMQTNHRARRAKPCTARSDKLKVVQRCEARHALRTCVLLNSPSMLPSWMCRSVTARYAATFSAP